MREREKGEGRQRGKEEEGKEGQRRRRKTKKKNLSKIYFKKSNTKIKNKKPRDVNSKTIKIFLLLSVNIFVFLRDSRRCPRCRRRQSAGDILRNLASSDFLIALKSRLLLSKFRVHDIKELFNFSPVWFICIGLLNTYIFDAFPG